MILWQNPIIQLSIPKTNQNKNKTQNKNKIQPDFLLNYTLPDHKPLSLFYPLIRQHAIMLWASYRETICAIVLVNLHIERSHNGTHWETPIPGLSVKRKTAWFWAWSRPYLEIAQGNPSNTEGGIWTAAIVEPAALAEHGHAARFVDRGLGSGEASPGSMYIVYHLASASYATESDAIYMARCSRDTG